MVNIQHVAGCVHMNILIAPNNQLADIPLNNITLGCSGVVQFGPVKVDFLCLNSSETGFGNPKMDQNFPTPNISL